MQSWRLANLSAFTILFPVVIVIAIVCGVGCSERTKGTLGTPGTFTAEGEGPNLRSSIRKAEENINSLFFYFPVDAEGRMFQQLSRHSPILPTIKAMLKAENIPQIDQRVQGLKGEWLSVKDVGKVRSIQVVHHFSTDLTTFEYMETFPEFLFLRMFQVMNKTNGQREVHILHSDLSRHSMLVFSLEGRQAFILDSVTESGHRHNGCILLENLQEQEDDSGGACSHLRRYRKWQDHDEDSIPEVFHSLEQELVIDPNRQYQAQNLQDFYENF